MRVFYSIILVVAFLFISCNTEPSLQKYFVEHETAKDFVVVDIPSSYLNVQKDSLSKREKEAVESFEKLNILAFKVNDSNKEKFASEVKKVKEILSNKQYTQLVKMKDSDMNFDVKYLGSENDIEEVVVFGSSSNKGFGVIRVLGDDLKPENIVSFMNAMRTAKIDDAKFKEVANFFKD